MEGETIWERAAAANNNEQAKARANSLQEILMAAESLHHRVGRAHRQASGMLQPGVRRSGQNDLVAGYFRIAGYSLGTPEFASHSLASMLGDSAKSEKNPCFPFQGNRRTKVSFRIRGISPRAVQMKPT
jgi:hypothetical protein